MNKQVIETVHARNLVIDNIIDALQSKNHFLMLGHKNPDEDCLASMVAFALIVSKFSKKATVCLRARVHEHFQYLLSICRHNAIHCSATVEEGGEPVDALVLCDTP
jgi:nanoRNase/pAp phosphatase (c-di-AMP/oligoRNAs hydrolase)